MTNEAFNELFSTFYLFIISYTWAIIIVGLFVFYSIYLGRKMDKFQCQVKDISLPSECYSKESFVGWRNTMYSAWRIGVGALIPSFIVFAVHRYLPEKFVEEKLSTMNTLNFNLSQAFWFLQAIVFLILLSIKFRAIWDCRIAASVAHKAGFKEEGDATIGL